MKSVSILLASLLPLTAVAFAPAQTSPASSHATKSINAAIHAYASHAKQIPSHTRRHVTMTAEELVDLSEEEMHAILGVEKEKIALGIDADEVLEFIGTREDLITKFQTDIPKFSRSEAEKEVDKFFMDGEMLDLWIKYGQRKKEDPNWEPEYAEEDNSPFAVFSRIVGTYAIWIVGGLLVKDLVTGYFNKQNGGGGGGEEIAVAANTVVDAIHQISSTLTA
mmetsp:Transcript_89/g.171  ORF Transcript_89/g.171 Transcript_89/m.171 type:complete len:222 (+) Transcript_89:71-736(+)|eukprot:CAMPEP_0171353856 /NCGR_PEP_ID=MMETSP0878-20121228/44408_1 /TAXON_ID=67004 /ORGANISM="Thalassiosira weissflogii, Strain CCMP1336" /LENGTH=221 /DNA_ID=CAMNT_0011859813 /DNA_START=681 /DNA_END=1346 /DNA_ORIENTATION=-